MSYKQSAKEILQAIGGEENLEAMAHCARKRWERWMLSRAHSPLVDNIKSS